MKWVTLQTGATPFGGRETVLCESQIAAWTALLSVRQCCAIAEIVTSELWRRGLRHVRTGGRYYRAMEALVVSRLVLSDADLDEIAAQIEEAKLYADFDSPKEKCSPKRAKTSHFQQQKISPMALKTKAKPTKKESSYTPTKLHPQAAASRETKAFFRDGDRLKPMRKEGNAPEEKIFSDAKLNEFARRLSKLERETAAVLIEGTLVNQGVPKTTRRGGSLWRKARAQVLSGLIQRDADLSEIRADMQNSGMKLESLSDEGIILEEL